MACDTIETVYRTRLRVGKTGDPWNRTVGAGKVFHYQFGMSWQYIFSSGIQSVFLWDRVDRELRRAGHPNRKSRSPDTWKSKGNLTVGKLKTQKENLAAAYATPEADQKAADTIKPMLQVT